MAAAQAATSPSASSSAAPVAQQLARRRRPSGWPGRAGRTPWPRAARWTCPRRARRAGRRPRRAGRRPPRRDWPRKLHPASMPSSRGLRLETAALRAVADHHERQLGHARRGRQQRVDVLDRVQAADEGPDEPVARQPEPLAQPRALLGGGGPVDLQVDPVGERRGCASAGTPCASSSSLASSLSAANQADRNSSRALIRPSGLRARRARSPCSPVPRTVTRQGSPSRRPPQGDRGGGQRAVRMDEVDPASGAAGGARARRRRRRSRRAATRPATGVRCTTEPGDRLGAAASPGPRA